MPGRVEKRVRRVAVPDQTAKVQYVAALLPQRTAAFGAGIRGQLPELVLQGPRTTARRADLGLEFQVIRDWGRRIRGKFNEPCEHRTDLPCRQYLVDAPGADG